MADSQFDEKTLKRAEFCMSKCTACVKGRRREKGFWHAMVKLEDTLRLCPWCKAYKKVYGVPAYQNPPS